MSENEASSEGNEKGDGDQIVQIGVSFLVFGYNVDGEMFLQSHDKQGAKIQHLEPKFSPDAS